MPPEGVPERIWKTDDLQRLDDLLSAENGRTPAERAAYLDDLQALDDPKKLVALVANKRYFPPWPNVIGPDLEISQYYGIYGDKDSQGAKLTVQHLRQDWYTSKAATTNPQTGKAGWWNHSFLVSDLDRQAVIQTGTLAIAKGLPVDSYWVNTGSDSGDAYGATPLQCFITWNKRQIMLFLLTPAPGTGYLFGPPSAEERRKMQISCKQSWFGEATAEQQDAATLTAAQQEEKPLDGEERRANLNSLLSTPAGQRLLDLSDPDRQRELKDTRDRLRDLRTHTGRHKLEGTGEGDDILAMTKDPVGRQVLSLIPDFGMTIVGPDVYGDVMAWPTRANASYWLKDQFNPSKLPRHGDEDDT